MSLSAARLAPLANRTAVTIPLGVSAFSKLIPSRASSSRSEASQLKNSAADGTTVNAVGNQLDRTNNHEAGVAGHSGFSDESHGAENSVKKSDDQWLYGHNIEKPYFAEHYVSAPGRRWSTGVKESPDGSCLSRTMLQPPTFPFAGKRHLSTTSDTTKIPDFSKYMHKSGGHNETSRAFTYLMVGSTGMLTAVAAKACIQDLLTSLAPSAAAVALAKVEVDLNKVPEGKNIVIKWRGKPIFIRHRTAAEIQEANNVDVSKLRDKETDADRVKDPAYLIMIGVCTHLGCIPIGEAGEYNGWFCPCHGSHYDISGRIRKGPAPLNLEIPPYNISSEKLCVIG